MKEIEKGIYQDDTEDTSKFIVNLKKEFFEKEPIMQAIHEYSNDFFTSMNSIEENLVSIIFTPKDCDNYDLNLIKNFSNRVIDYQIRKDLEREYGHIRDTIVEYAYSPLKKKTKLNVEITNNYNFLPLSFKKYSEKEMLLVNFSGEHFFIAINEFQELLAYKLDNNSQIFKTLKSKLFIYENVEELNIAIELLSTQLRTKQRYLRDFTSLHMLEITNYCNLKCDYCHASTVSVEEMELKKHNNLRKDILDKTIDMIFQSPSQSIKIELQGGEPLVNWDNCKYLIENAYNRSLDFKDKRTELILCTNLILIDEEKLLFLKKYDVHISTSLDGTEELHDKHRTTHNGKPSYNKFIENLELSRKILGHDKIGALLTVTRDNLHRIREVIDEYIRLGFEGLFIRALNPYGMATKNLDELGYPTEDFIDAYKDALKYIIQLNLEGKFFIDYYSSLLFKRISTPFSTGFMDLQSPAGAGISGVIYDFNGDVYPTDESRMLARMGNNEFKIGNVLKDSYESIFLNEKLIEITRKSILQTTPSCSNCTYNAYCGSDPIRNYVESNDIVGYKPDSEFCRKNISLMDHIFDLLKENDPNTMDVFWSWINMRNLGEIRV